MIGSRCKSRRKTLRDKQQNELENNEESLTQVVNPSGSVQPTFAQKRKRKNQAQFLNAQD